MAADFGKHHFGRVLQALRFRFERGCGEEAGRHAKMGGHCMDRRFVCLEVDRADGSEACPGETTFGKRFLGQSNRLFRLCMPLAAHSEHKRLRMINEFQLA